MTEETRFVLNSFAFLFWGVLVMWMCAGFTILEAGSVRTKNASVVCLKNIGLYAIAGLTYYFVGYSIMHVGVETGGWFGSVRFAVNATSAEQALVQGDGAAVATVVQTGHASMSHWFFQMVFVASTASIVSGTLAERVRLWAFFLFVVVLTAVIYPLVGAWTWGGGWLDALGFRDYAGATVVHSTGVWGSLAVCIAAGGHPGVQAVGILTVAIFVFCTALGVWWLVDRAVGARITAHVEALGQDATELGIESFPEFVLAPQAMVGPLSRAATPPGMAGEVGPARAVRTRPRASVSGVEKPRRQ